MVKRIKHNNLLPWFTDDHGTLPAAYVNSCMEFFEWLKQCNKEGFKAPSNKRQATSHKRQAGKVTRCNLSTTMLNKKPESENQK
jgi:hypothetical protein